MAKESISIIVPVYNTGSFLQQCIDSLLNQTYKDIEILLINDGSTDDSLSICQQAAIKDTRVRVITKENTGVSDTRNVGILEAKYSLLTFVDSDDYLSETLLQELMENYQGEDLVFSTYTFYKNNEFLLNEISLEKPIQEVKDLGGDNFSALYQSMMFNSPVARLYKKELIEETFLTDLDLGEDLLFNLNYLTRVQSVKYVDTSGYFYRLTGNETSLTKKYMPNRLEQVTHVHEQSLESFQQLFPDNFDLNLLVKKYLEEYALSLKKMLSEPSLSRAERLETLAYYAQEFPVSKAEISQQNLSIQYRLFLELYQRGFYKTLIILVGWLG